MDIYRQGDVYIIKKDKIDKPMKAVKEMVLAEGEVTGHAHRLKPQAGGSIQVFKNELDMAFKVEEKAAIVTHEEHAPIELDPGYYEVYIQREYDPVAYQRKVAD